MAARGGGVGRMHGSGLRSNHRQDVLDVPVAKPQNSSAATVINGARNACNVDLVLGAVAVHQRSQHHRRAWPRLISFLDIV